MGNRCYSGTHWTTLCAWRVCTYTAFVAWTKTVQCKSWVPAKSRHVAFIYRSLPLGYYGKHCIRTMETCCVTERRLSCSVVWISKLLYNNFFFCISALFQECFPSIVIVPITASKHQIHPLNIFPFVIVCTIHDLSLFLQMLFHHYFSFLSLLLPGLTCSVYFMKVSIILSAFSVFAPWGFYGFSQFSVPYPQKWSTLLSMLFFQKLVKIRKITFTRLSQKGTGLLKL